MLLRAAAIHPLTHHLMLYIGNTEGPMAEYMAKGMFQKENPSYLVLFSSHIQSVVDTFQETGTKLFTK